MSKARKGKRLKHANPNWAGGKTKFVCKFCGQKFEAYKSKSRGLRKYCSKKCANNCPIRKMKMRIKLLGKTGEDSKRWQGGKSEVRHNLASLDEYKQWRADVFKRDNWTCQTCGKRGCYLEAHHIKEVYKLIDEYNIKDSEDAIKCKELWDISNGVTLCKDCHNLTKGWKVRRANG